MKTTGKMHADELSIDIACVRRLLASQFPQWAMLPIEPVTSAGTVNALYRLGDGMVVRFPRTQGGVEAIHKEFQWLPQLAPHLPLTIPVPLEKGAPDHHYPWQWSIYRWLDGVDATNACIAKSHQAATDLAHFINALQRVKLPENPPSGRGETLQPRDAQVREAIEVLHDSVDTEAATIAWEVALQLPAWKKPLRWIHGDLISPNVLVKHGEINAVIDFGTLGVGDPACDLIAAWSIFSAETRKTFRSTLNTDASTWARGRGWALSQALVIIPYYQETNPALVAVAKRMIEEILAEK